MSMGGGGGTQTVRQELSPEQKQLLSLVIPRAREFVQNPPTLGAPVVQPFNPAQVEAQELVKNTIPGLSAAGTGQLNALQFLSGPVLSPESNPALAETIQASVRPIQEQFTQSVLPNIRSTAVSGGSFGGSRQGVAEGIASQAFLRQVGDTASQVANEGFQSGLDALSRSLFAGPTAVQTGLSPATALSSVGAQIQGQDERAAAEAAQRFFQEQILPFVSAQEVAGLAFGIPAGTATTAASGGTFNPVQGALGGAALGAGLAAGTSFGTSLLGASLAGGPAGAMVGALAGLLLS